MSKKKAIAILITAVMMIMTVIPVGATTQDKITDAQAEKNAAESKLAAAQEKIDDLETKKSQLETYLDQLHTQLTGLEEDLEEVQTQINEKEVELEMLQAALGRAKEQEAKQYQEMKLRIQYMYENANGNLLTTLLESQSITEFLTRAETISQLSAYDREQLTTYQETKAQIETQEQEVVDETSALEKLKEESQQKQQELTELANTTDTEINEYTSIISEEEINASDLQSKINQQKTLLADLQAQAEAEKKAAEEKAAKEAEVQRLAAEQAARQAAEEAASKESAAQRNGSVASNTSSQSTTSQTQTSNESVVSNTTEEASSESTSTSGGKLLGTFKLTAYCACARCCGKSDGITASGTVATPGRTVAMAGVPFGTKLMINGTVYTVEDRGTSYGHVDVFFNNHSAALQFGLQYAEVYQMN